MQLVADELLPEIGQQGYDLVPKVQFNPALFLVIFDLTDPAHLHGDFERFALALVVWLEELDGAAVEIGRAIAQLLVSGG